MELEVCNTNDDNDEDEFDTDALELPKGHVTDWNTYTHTYMIFSYNSLSTTDNTHLNIETEREPLLHQMLFRQYKRVQLKYINQLYNRLWKMYMFLKL